MRFGLHVSSGVWIFSSVLHLSVLAVLGTVWLHEDKAAPTQQVQASWEEESAAETVELSTESVVISSTMLNESEVFKTTPLLDSSAMEIPTDVPQRLEVATSTSGQSETPGAANGQGNGDSVGGGGKPITLGNGFFGKALDGQSVVFVVDASRSMNHPHESVAKTRFRRLKIEMVHAISLLQPNQRFFIIFFNENPMPMPAKGMPLAIPVQQHHYLAWAQRVKANGDTDPRVALKMALALNPDVIHFLTDGSFLLGIQKDLMTLRQPRTRINTYAFGDPASEELLKQVAEQNRGKYTFVP